MTVVIKIGNQEDTLSQVEWSLFISYVNDAIVKHSSGIHFSGGSSYQSPVQSACWVCEVTEDKKDRLFEDLSYHTGKFNQDSVAVLIGETHLIKGK